VNRFSTPTREPVKSFELLLDKYWEKQEVKYDYNKEIKNRTGSHKKKFIVDIDEEDADIHVRHIVVERPASIEANHSICQSPCF
jgi:hypothetical protein